MTTNLPKLTTDKFPAALAYDIAMNAISEGDILLFADEDLMALYGYTQEELNVLKTDIDFRVAVRAAVHELKSSGDTVRHKMRMQFDSYLSTIIPQMMYDPEVPPKDKIELVKMLGKGGGVLEDSKLKQEAQAALAQSNNQPVFKLILQTTQPEPRLIIDQE